MRTGWNIRTNQNFFLRRESALSGLKSNLRFQAEYQEIPGIGLPEYREKIHANVGITGFYFWLKFIDLRIKPDLWKRLNPKVCK